MDRKISRAMKSLVESLEEPGNTFTEKKINDFRRRCTHFDVTIDCDLFPLLLKTVEKQTGINDLSSLISLPKNYQGIIRSQMQIFKSIEDFDSVNYDYGAQFELMFFAKFYKISNVISLKSIEISQKSFHLAVNGYAKYVLANLGGKGQFSILGVKKKIIEVI